MRLNKATPEQILAAAERELSLALKRLVGCRNRVYRETGTYPDDLGAAIFRLEFVLHHIMAGLVTPAPVKAEPGPDWTTGFSRVRCNFTGAGSQKDSSSFRWVGSSIRPRGTSGRLIRRFFGQQSTIIFQQRFTRRGPTHQFGQAPDAAVCGKATCQKAGPPVNARRTRPC